MNPDDQARWGVLLLGVAVGAILATIVALMTLR